MIKSNIGCPKCGGKMRSIFCEIFFDNKNGNQFVEVHYNCPMHKRGTPWKVMRYALNCGGVRSYMNGSEYVEGEMAAVDMTLRESVVLAADDNNFRDDDVALGLDGNEAYD
jgi:hypothetical protein